MDCLMRPAKVYFQLYTLPSPAAGSSSAAAVKVIPRVLVQPTFSRGGIMAERERNSSDRIGKPDPDNEPTPPKIGVAGQLGEVGERKLEETRQIQRALEADELTHTEIAAELGC